MPLCDIYSESVNHRDFSERPPPGEVESLLEELEPGRDVLPRLVEALRESLGAERAVAYGVDVGPEQYLASFCHGAGFPLPSGVLYDTVNDFLPTLNNPWGYFDPARPAPSQRNRALHFRPLAQPQVKEAPLHDVSEGAWRKLGISPEEQEQVHARVSASAGVLFRKVGLERMYQLRALVCDGPSLLAWVGAFRGEPFTAREVRRLQGLVPALQRRLGLEGRLREAGLLTAALEAAMEVLPQPTYVVTSAGRVVYANTAGRARLERSLRRLSAELRRATRGEPTGEDFTLTPLRSPGLGAHFLVIDRGANAHAFARVHALAARWALTAREAEVLERIVQGETNKVIAARLGCAERTVEVHVTHVLSKAQVESRAALIAKFFQAS
jgi:DNA-binding CsgD family transcriptional regulator